MSLHPLRNYFADSVGQARGSRFTCRFRFVTVMLDMETDKRRSVETGRFMHTRDQYDLFCYATVCIYRVVQKAFWILR